MIDPNQFVIAVEKMRAAQLRYRELMLRAIRSEDLKDYKAADGLLEIQKQLEIAVDELIVQINQESVLAKNILEQKPGV